MSRQKSISHEEALRQAYAADPMQAVLDMHELARQANELEAQRDYLAKLLGDLCTSQKDGQCPLFYACPAPGLGWSCGNAIKENWIYAAEKAEEGDGE